MRDMRANLGVFRACVLAVVALLCLQSGASAVPATPADGSHGFAAGAAYAADQPWTAQGDPAIVQKVKNGSDLAWEYINSMLAPGPQAEVERRMNYETSNPKAVLPPDIKTRITPWQQCRFAPADQVAAAKASWIERWNKEIDA